MASRARPGKSGLALQVRGALWLTADGQSIGGHGRIDLLRAVQEQGSITQAAKAFGMSYKAAWDAINAMNERASQPVVERVVGGRGGGATRLTDFGQRLVARYEQVNAVHQRFLHLIEQEAMDLDQDFSLLKVLNMKTSARNQWVGQVSAVRAGTVNDEVEITLAGGTRLAATVTRESTHALDLKTRSTVIALVKSSAVLLATELGDARLSARNRFDGRVLALTPGAVNAEVVVRCGEGDRAVDVVAVVPQGSVADLGLLPGAAVTALVKASDVVLAIVT